MVTRQDIARFEDRQFSEAWADAQPRFRAHVLGPHFEQLCRDFTFRFASLATIGGKVAKVGAAVVNDARAKAQYQLDVVATTRRADGATAVAAIGEAKCTTAARTIADLERLEHMRVLVVDRGQALLATRLLLFSGTGFDQNLAIAAEARDHVELIDLNRLYHGD